MPCFVFWSERQPNNIDHAYFYLMGVRSYICVHILSDRGDLSNLIGSLSRTIQQCSPPSEWIMCELGVFPFFFLENDLLKVDKILGLTFFKARKDLKDSKRRFSIYCSWVLCSIDCLQLPFIRVEGAVSWTHRFLTRNIWPKNRILFMTNKFESKCLQNSTFQINRKKNATGRWRHTSTFLSALHGKNDTTNLFGYKLGESTENNKVLLFISGKETILTFNGFI